MTSLLSVHFREFVSPFFLFEQPVWPLEEPVLVFTLALFVFLIGPLAIKRLGQPGIVGVVLLGAALGPYGLGVVGESLIQEGGIIEALGSLGLIYLLFTVGLELDLRGFKEQPGSAAVFGLSSFLIPFFVGTAIGWQYLGLDIWAAILLSAVFSSHTLLAYPIVNQYGVTQNRAVTAVFGGILFTDTLALVVLAIAVDAATGGLTALLFADVALSLAILFVAVWFLIPPIARSFFQNFSEESYFEFLFVVVVFFAAASLAVIVDISAILGAFVAGIALNRVIPEGGTLMTRIEFVGNAFFIPFFLLYVGMLVDPGVIFEGFETLEIAAVIIGVMLVTKYLAVRIVGRIEGYTPNERGVMFGLSTGQAAAALAVTLVGFNRGLFDEIILNAVVLMLLVTAVVSPWLTRRASNKLAQEKEIDEDGEATDPRILLPLSHHADLQRRLLELSFLLKGERKETPVHVLTVISPDGPEETETEIAKTQQELDELREIGNEAEIEVETETRVNYNPASGIVRGAAETQSDLVLMGWDASTSLTQRIFGSIIDQVLELTRLPVLVARLGHPINTTDRMFVVVPHAIDHHEGFFEGVHLLKKVADKTGAELHVITLGSGAGQYERLFDIVEPEVGAAFQSLPSWDELIPHLRSRSEDDDLVTVLSPRKGQVGWDPALATLPRQLATLPPESFLIVTLREGDPEYDRKFLRFE